MSDELFKKIKANVGPGFGTDYINLGIRLVGSTVYVEGYANSQHIIEDYASKVEATDGVTKVIIDASVHDSN